MCGGKWLRRTPYAMRSSIFSAGAELLPYTRKTVSTLYHAGRATTFIVILLHRSSLLPLAQARMAGMYQLPRSEDAL